MVPALSHKVSRVSWYSGYCLAAFGFGYASLTLSGRPFHAVLLPSAVDYAVLTPECKHSGLGSFPFARRYSGNRFFFLFLWVLRCFSSPGSPCMAMYSPYSDRGILCQVSPFRNRRVNGYVLLTAAFRSLSRLSSALSAKASTLRSLYLDLLILAFSIYSVILSALFLLRIFRYVFGCLTKSYLIYLLTMCSFQGTYWLSGSHCIN